MSKLSLSVAMGDYDRTRALYDGRVQIDGVDPVYMLLSPEEMFFRAMRSQDFDVAEISLSSYLIKHARGECPYIGIPVFLSRAFRHTSIYVRKDRIREPADLRGKRIGIPEYQLTANVWARGILHSEYGVHPKEMMWVQGGIETPGRPEKINIQLPEDIRIEPAPADTTISELLDRGDIDGFIAPRPPSRHVLANPQIAWLFDDPVATASSFYRKTKVFPIMHIVGVRKTLAAQHPWLPNALFKAFQQSKARALDALSDTSATKVTMPFVEEQLFRARQLLGDDYWSYGAAAAAPTLNMFLDYHHQQGLSPRRMELSELFHPSTYESYSI